jgi:hypothetical protein
MKKTPEKALNGKPETGTVMDRLLARVADLGYGEIQCRLKVHDGQISQIDIEAVTERLR